MDTYQNLAEVMVKAREQYELETREDLMTKIEKLCSRWRHHSAVGFDAEQRSPEERAEGFERALRLLSEVHEYLEDM